MKCNCSNWDDDKPCEAHNPKLPQPEVVEHHCITVKIGSRHSNLKWFYIVVKDGVRSYVSPDLDVKPRVDEAGRLQL